MGKLPVIDASVDVHISSHPGSHTKLQLYDVTKSDGIYKRYFTPSEPGLYKFEIFAHDNGQVSYVQIGKESYSNVSEHTKEIGEC